MNQISRALLSLLLVFLITLGGMGQGLASGVDFTLAEKLQKQLEAGSGFGGTLTLTLTAVEGRERDALTTVSPLVFDLSYIFVRQTADSPGPPEHRLDIAFPSGDSPWATFSMALRDEDAYLRSSLLDSDWYSLGELLTLSGSLAGDEEDESSGGEEAGLRSAPMERMIQDLMKNTAMPSLLSFLASMSLVNRGGSMGSDLQEALGAYTTKIDLWIESHRQSAVLDKLEDGTTTMEIRYAIPPAALKAQLKQLVLDLLSDDALLNRLQAFLPADQARLMLNPQMQNFYFSAVDDLPIEKEITLSRTMTMRGDTVALHLRLPLYDATSGSLELAYDRVSGLGDLPDENVISLTGKDIAVRLSYQEYSTMTGVMVYQGSLLIEPRGLASYMVEDGADSGNPGVSAAFILTHAQAEQSAIEGESSLTHDVKLSLEPCWFIHSEGLETPMTQEEQADYLHFPALEIALNAVFSGKASNTSPTGIDATLTVGGEELPQTFELHLLGKSKARWAPEPVTPADAGALMAGKSLSALLVQAGFQASLRLLPSFHLPGMGGMPEAEDTAEPEDLPEAEDAPGTEEDGEHPEDLASAEKR